MAKINSIIRHSQIKFDNIDQREVRAGEYNEQVSCLRAPQMRSDIKQILRYICKFYDIRGKRV